MFAGPESVWPTPNLRIGMPRELVHGQQPRNYDERRSPKFGRVFAATGPHRAERDKFGTHPIDVGKIRGPMSAGVCSMSATVGRKFDHIRPQLWADVDRRCA